MRPHPYVAALLATAALAVGCGSPASNVRSDQATLGRVVVYRNGIAYYERRAQVDGDRLTLRVPADKVDDFLKSLTVADAKTGEALPISFPSPGTANSGQVEMTIQLPNRQHRDVLLTYVTDSPAWKPSYRVVVGDTGKVALQGWAIVDNTSGEDWQAVRVGVGSSSALSFRFDLHSIRLVHRETLRSQDTFAKAPPRGGSLVPNADGPREEVLGVLADLDIPRPAGHPDVADEEMLAAAQMDSREVRGQAAAARAPRYRKATEDDKAKRPDAHVAALAKAVQSRGGPVMIEGYAEAQETNANEKALDRANMLRNQLIEQGVAPARLHVVAKGVVAGQRAGVRLVEVAQKDQGGDGKPGPDEAAAPVGEGHFESASAMTVGAGTSAMVSILQGDATGDIVYLYDAEGDRGDERYAFRAIRFRNPTTSMLESGPMTVYGNGRFIGEGLTDPIPAGAVAVIPFALDRQVVVDRDASTGDRMSRLVKLQRGVLTAEVQHFRTTKLRLTNRLPGAVTVHVRHTLRRGWEFVRSPQVVEQFGEARLFAVEVAGHSTQVLEIEEATPLTRTVDLRSPVGIELVQAWVQTAKEDGQVTAAMQKVLQYYHEMVRQADAIEHLRGRGDEFRIRMDELQAQLMGLRNLKSAGSLLSHLQEKLKEMSQKVQENTLAIVAAEERQMLARVEFHDQLAELTLDQKAATADQTEKRPSALASGR
jgi:hypothetical protein